MPTYYQIFGLSKEASSEDIRKAYRKLARLRHPDVEQGNLESMVELNKAYEVLKDPCLREQYDLSLEQASYRLPKRPKPIVVDPLKFLQLVFYPLDAGVRQAFERLQLAIEELAYDIYDEAYVAPFGAAFQGLRTAMDHAFLKLRTSDWPNCWNSPINLYLQGMRQLEDGLCEFDDFLESFDIDQLVTGREFLAVGEEILAVARAALG